MNIAEIREKYPQYADMDDVALASALHKKFYADMPMEQFAAKIGLQQPKAPEPPSLLDQIKRQAGLTGRYVVEGALALPNMVGDAVNTGINMVAGTNLGMPSQAVSQGLTKMGLPEPQGALENAVAAGSRALSGVGGVAQMAKAAPALAPLGENMLVQGQAAIGAAMGGEAAKNAEMGPGAQFGAALAGGLAAPAAINATGRLASAGRELLRPLTQSGQEQIVGSAMQRMATNPQAAQQAAQNPQQFVPGSTPTTAQAAGDLGLLAGERAVRAQNPAAFAANQVENNAARLAALRGVTGPDDAIAQAEAAREAVTAPLRQQALTTAKPVNTAPVEKLIDSISAGSKNAQLRNTLDEIKFEMNRNGDTSAAGMYEVRKLIDWKLDTSIPEHRALQKHGATSLKAVKTELDKALNKATGNQFQQYLDAYKQLSKPVDQAKAGAKILGRFDAAQVDVGGNPTLTPFAMKRAVASVENPVTKGGAETIFTQPQMKTIQDIIADLDRASLSNAAVKSVGSDTYQNLSTGNLIGRSLGPGMQDNSMLTAAIRRPLDFLYKPAEQKMQGLLAEGLLDPKKGADFLGKGLPKKQRMALKELLEYSVYGGLLGSAADR